jgi:hypothetical protein
MNPWRMYLLLVQDFARWTGTYGGMIISYLHGTESIHMHVVTLTMGRDTLETCTRKKEGCCTRDTPIDLDPGDIAFPPGR